ncbi:hypothetical protein SUDANB105_07041 [Streptomyces sp. enrichment culture]
MTGACALGTSGGLKALPWPLAMTIDWEDLPTALPEKRLKPVFVRADV